MSETVPVTVVDGDTETTVAVERGRVLRDALLEHDFDVYRRSRPSASGSFGNLRFP